jgi:putative ABC transport system ATP-binding protein
MTRTLAVEPTTTPLAPLVVELRGAGVGTTARHSRSQPPAAILRPVDLAVRPGEMVVLTGQASAARSSLLNVIGLLIRPTTGSYLLYGQDTARLGDRDMAALRGRDIGLVLQPPHLLPARSALENVMLPLVYSGLPRRARKSVALDCLERVGMGARAHALAGDLPADERQRTGIARALAAGPSLLLCDEPTTGLDAGQAARVIGLLNGLRSDGRTVLVASSDQLTMAFGARNVNIGELAPRQGGGGAGGTEQNTAR